MHVSEGVRTHIYEDTDAHTVTHRQGYTYTHTDGHRHTGTTSPASPHRAVNMKVICLPSGGKHAGVIKIFENREMGQATRPKGEGREAGHIS